MDARVSRLEEEMGEVRAFMARIEPMIVRIDAQMPFLSTLRGQVSTDIATLRGEVSTEISTLRGQVSTDISTLRGEIMAELATKPSRGAMRAMGIALFTLSLTGTAVGSVYLPYVAARLHLLQ